MKTIKLSAILIALCAVTFSCKTNKILTADFESDALNSPPTKNLPGAPTGDEITYNDAIVPRLKVMSSTLAGAKSLHYIDNSISSSISGHARWLAFKGIGTNLTQTLWFVYTGQIHGKGVTVDISDGSANTMGRLVITNSGDVSVVHSFEPEAPHHTMGNIGSGPHTVVFTVNASGLSYNVTIFRDNGTALTAENQPMITTDALLFSNPARPTLSFLLMETSGSGSYYEIGSVTISKKKP